MKRVIILAIVGFMMAVFTPAAIECAADLARWIFCKVLWIPIAGLIAVSIRMGTQLRH